MGGVKITVNYQMFPRSQKVNSKLLKVIEVMSEAHPQFDSQNKDSEAAHRKSNEVLAYITEGLKREEFKVEEGKKNKITVPVLYGLNGAPEKAFDADAYHEDEKIVIEIEAGRAWSNHQFLKDVVQACLMPDVEYLVLAVKNTYWTKKGATDEYSSSDDFNKIYNFLESMYVSDRFKLPLKGILLIGY